MNFTWTPHTVTINGIRIPIDIFHKLEKNFVVPAGCVRISYTPGKPGTWETSSNQYTLESWFDAIGKRCIARVNDFVYLMEAEAKEAQEIKRLSDLHT